MDNQNTDRRFPVDVTKKPSLLHKILGDFKKRPPKNRLAIVSGISVGVLIAGVVGIQFFGPKPAELNPEPKIESTYQPPPPPAPTTVASSLTGTQIEPSLNQRPVTGVMIENSIDARPQAALVDAGVVFEAIAEGGITRFLALFQEAQPDYIGPIRSARPYYVRWAAGFNAGYVHSGGSGEALALISALGVKDMDHGKVGGGTFDRVSNRFAPHNVYTSMARLDTLRTTLGHAPGEFEGFERIAPLKEGEAPKSQGAGEKASTINFDISGANYNTSYAYNPETNSYNRVMAGQPHTDERSGKQISPNVVIALEATYGIHADRVHSVYGNVGSGEVTVFQNGEVIRGTWSKPTDTAPLKFKTATGEALLLQPGQTWITAIHNKRYSFAP